MKANRQMLHQAVKAARAQYAAGDLPPHALEGAVRQALPGGASARAIELHTFYAAGILNATSRTSEHFV